MTGLALPKPVKPEKVRKRIRTRRPPGTKRREAKAAGGVDPDTWEAILAFYAYRCAYCARLWEQQGHCKALAKGGQHCAGNVVPICKRCNYNQMQSERWPERRHQWMEKPCED